MTLRPQSLPPVPEAMAAALHAAFPRGNLDVELRAEFGTLYDDQLFADLYPPSGRPVEVAPWRLALVVVMQYIEGLTDPQAADAVRRCMDWKYALGLELTDPGFDFSLVHDFPQRILAHAAGQRFLDAFLAACKARGWIKARGTQRTDSTHVLATIRTLHRVECVLEAMHYALNQLSDVAPAWVQQHVPLAWYDRYGLRSDQARLPKDASKRESLARQIGADGYRLLEWVHVPESPANLCDLPALEALRRIWVQQYYRCTAPGYEALRWRAGDEQPPSAVRIASPYDLEARYSSKRETHWVGYKVHLTETCDGGHPHLITQVITTPTTT
jgi:transposase